MQSFHNYECRYSALLYTNNTVLLQEIELQVKMKNNLKKKVPTALGVQLVSRKLVN